MEASLPQLILPIKLERSSERLTSLGGLVVLEELARAVGLWEGQFPHGLRSCEKIIRAADEHGSTQISSLF
jgi:hypothetical protein